MEKTKALIGRESIRSYLDVSKNVFYDLWKNRGMPVIKDGPRLIAYKDILDEYFRKKLDKNYNPEHT